MKRTLWLTLALTLALAGPALAVEKHGGLALSYAAPQGLFDKLVGDGYGLSAIFDYPMTGYVDITGSLGWYRFSGITLIEGTNIETDSTTMWEFAAGPQFDLKALYVGVEGGYWTEFEWDKALRLGAEATGLAYSGEFGFAPTKMYWPLAHMIPPAAEALTCVDCHAEGGRMDWEALGYGSDPIRSGGRNSLRSVGTKREAGEQ